MSSKAVKPKNNSARRYTLSEEEAKLLLHFRETGTILPQFLLKSDINAAKIRNKAKELNMKYKEAVNELTNASQRIDLLCELKDVKPGEIKIAPKGGVESESVAVAVASDWHVEERVDAETVNHLNEFNPDIAKRRIRRFFQKIVFLTELSRGGTKIETLILALLGDLISGFIHEEGMESNYMAPLPAIRLLQGELIAGINFLKEYGGFERIYIPCSFGNHGRTTKKTRYGTAADNSYEQHMYFTLKNLYENDPVVEFKIDSSYLTYVTVFDKYVLRFHHGDSIRYAGGIGGITIPVNKAIAQWNKSRTAYLDVFGHYHQMLDGGKFISNGSIIGFNAYALGIKASYEEPKQAFFLVDKNRGKTAVHPIFVEIKNFLEGE